MLCDRCGHIAKGAVGLKIHQARSVDCYRRSIGLPTRANEQKLIVPDDSDGSLADFITEIRGGEDG